MKIRIIFLLFLPLLGYAQHDKISVSATLDTITKSLFVQQKITFYNDTDSILNSIYLHSSANSYSNNHTLLGKRKLEDRNKILYFAKPFEKGRISDFTIFIDKVRPQFLLKDFEFFEINLLSPLLPKENITIELNYSIKLPTDRISGYGYSKEGNYLLKYFFLRPLEYHKGKPLLESYTDTEFNPYRKTEYEITLFYPKNYDLQSDLKVQENRLKGISKEEASISISKHTPNNFNIPINNREIEVSLGYYIADSLKGLYVKNIKRELEFLEEKVGELPDKIFINSKIKKLENFIGVDDIDIFGIKKWSLFTKEEQIDLKLFQQLSYNILNQKITLDKNNNHWIINGLVTYYQLQYLKKYYSKTKLLGKLPDEVKILGIKPIKYFFVSKVPLTDRYKLAYRYIATQNYDQPINEEYLKLSNINQFVISNFKAGLSFNFLAEYLGHETFESSIKEIIEIKKDKEITNLDLQENLENLSHKKLDWFFNNYINTHDRINFKINKFYSDEKQDSLKIKITNKTKMPLPILITAEKNNVIKSQKWVFSSKKDSLYSFPKGNYDKLSINKGYLFPEINDNDNVLSTSGFFKNRKKIQMKFYADVDNPEYTQIFYEPKIKWNNYDKFILGFRFFNSSPFSRPFEYSVAPTYSTGTNSLTGAASAGYNYDMVKGIFRRISIGADYSYFHYNKNLYYKKYGTALKFIFNKRPRSEVNRAIGISFNSVDREKNNLKKREADDYSHYNLLDISYSYSDTKVINEWSGKTDFQHSNLFDKISAEIYYRHEYLPGRKITLRFFGGYFFSNRSNSTYFNFGIDHISDYGFNYSDYLGRSATNGILYQQYIMSEGGFKSMIDKSSSKWITTVNGEIHLWKPFDLYADVGVYKNEGKPTKFIYDTGVKVRIIPDFLELYLPLQSTLGFEPKNEKYFSNIRFTFNLNLGAVINHFRKGWY